MKNGALILYRVCLWCVVGLNFFGCAQRAEYLRIEQFPMATIEKNILLAPGDTIDVKFLYWADLNDTQKIRADGYISLQLLGDVSIAGLSPQQASNYLEKQYSKEIKNPEIKVILREQASRVIYVGGQVQNSGKFDFTHQMTLLKALITAGGIVENDANPKQVVIIRQQDGKGYATAVDVPAMLHQKNPQPFYLAPGDIIFVPRTRISELNQWVQQYFTNMLPGTGFNISKQRGNTSIGISNQ